MPSSQELLEEIRQGYLPEEINLRNAATILAENEIGKESIEFEILENLMAFDKSIVQEKIDMLANGRWMTEPEKVEERRREIESNELALKTDYRQAIIACVENAFEKQCLARPLPPSPDGMYQYIKYSVETLKPELRK